MYITIDDKNYEVIIERKKIKHIYLRVRDDLKIYITASKWASLDEIKKILSKEALSIKKMIDKQMKKINDSNLILGKEVDIISVSNLKDPELDLDSNKFYIKDRNKLALYYKELALTIFKQRLDIVYKRFEEDIPYPHLRVRKMRSRWGVCNRKNITVTLNLELLKKDIKYIDYVILHELSHFIHFDHSSSFWSLVEKYNQDYKLLRKELRE